MPASISGLLEIFNDSTGHWNWPWIGAALLAAGGVIATAIRGIWAVFNFFVEHKRANDKKGGDTKVVQSEQGNASGRDTIIGRDAIYGADGRQIGHAVAEATKPLMERVERLFAENAELARKLEQTRVSPQAPGAQHAVGEAVQSIAQGAAEGDTRLQHALDLLKENKTTEAEALLKAFAEDKTTRVEQDRKEAAIAYRNLGAIAGLRDPKAAREAYAKAVSLDSDNAEGLSWDGWFQLQAKNLAAAEKSNRALLQLAGKGADEHQIFWSRTGLGDIAVARGDLNAALASYGEARSAVDRLAGSDAGNAAWQRDLSVSNNKIGDVLVKQGNLAEALNSYRAGLEIVERLAGSDAENAEWQRDLSVSNNKIGDVLVKQGNLAEALNSYRAGLVIRERLAGADAGDADWQRDLSVSNNKIGDVLVKHGNLAEALNSYRAGLEIAERLVGLDVGNANWQRDLSVSYNRVGDVLVKQGNLAEALNSYRMGLEIAERLAGSDAGNADWQRDLIVSCVKIAEVFPGEALVMLTRAAAIANQLRDEGRLAPADAWMPEDLARRLAELPKK